jgi:hypothetical protein
MNVNKIVEIVNGAENKSNKDLLDALQILSEEFEKTKDLVIDLTKHMDEIQIMYEKIDKELDKRKVIK